MERAALPRLMPPPEVGQAAPRGGPWEPAPDELIGTRLRDRFRVVSRGAEGGLSMVYVGADQRRRDAVAIKVLHAAHAGLPLIRARFAREAELAAQIGARIGAGARGSGLVAGRPFLVLDFLEGGTLREQLAAAEPLGPAEAARIADRVLVRLALLHGAGFVHQDLKPAHILAGGAALLDLGSALPIGALCDGAGCNPAYGAPEQWREGTLADPRADLFSVGAILFEMVHGRRPFRFDPTEPLACWAEREPPAADLAGPLGDLLRRSLAPHPERRFPSATAMREALAPLLAQTPEERR